MLKKVAAALAGSVLVATALAGCGAASTTTSSAPKAAHAVVAAEQESKCLVMDDAGEQRWFGQESASLSELGTKLTLIADAYQNEATGVAFCSHYDGAVFFAASPSEELLDKVAAVSDEYPDLTVTVEEVAAPLSTLRELTSHVFTVPELSGLITGAGPDVYTGGLAITVDESTHPLTPTLIDTIEDAVRELAGFDIPVRVTEGGTPVAAAAVIG